MKKSLLIYFGIIGVIAIYFFVIESIEPTGILFEEPDWYEDALNEKGTNIDGLLPSQKQNLAEKDFEYIKAYHEEDYISPTSYGVSFSRNWGVQGLINQDKDSPLEPKGWLFQMEDVYYTMVTFETEYIYNTEQLELGYVMFDYSNNFDIRGNYQISYIDEGEEYLLDSGYLSLAEDGSMLIPQCREVIRGMDMPNLIYTYHIFSHPTDDNDLENDMYFSMNVDVFYMIDQSDYTVQIGFNKFKMSVSYNKFTVVRNTVRYKEED